MVKVADLTLETTKFVNYAVNGVLAWTSGSATVPNPAANPIDFSFLVNFVYYGAITASTAYIRIQLKRIRDGVVLFQKDYSFSGSGTSTRKLVSSFFDAGAQANEAYQYTVTWAGGSPEGGGTAGSITITDQSIKALYIKK